MSLQQASFYCLQCRQQRLFTRQGTNHILHLIITFFLCGLWLPIWIIVALSEGSKPYFCSICGYSGSYSALANPVQTQKQLIAAQNRYTQKLNEPTLWEKFKASRVNAWLVNPDNTGKVIAGMLIIGFTGIIGVVASLEIFNTAKPQTLTNATVTKQSNTDANIKLFPVNEVCLYPAKVSNKDLRSLAGGSWQDFVMDGESLGFGCKTSSNSSQTEYQFYRKGGDLAQIEYAVEGNKRGAKYIAIDYFVSALNPIPNEQKFRQEYIRFVDEIVKLSLKQSLHLDTTKKISDLSTYSATGVPNEENIYIGDGRINLSRNRNNSTIFVKAQIYADKTAK